MVNRFCVVLLSFGIFKAPGTDVDILTPSRCGLVVLIKVASAVSWSGDLRCSSVVLLNFGDLEELSCFRYAYLPAIADLPEFKYF